VRRFDFDIAIIGAGAAGLSAARELSQSGLRIVIVEARDRIGGRVHTLHDPRSPLPIELGAEFVHGETSETLSILRRQKHPFYMMDGDDYLFEGKTLRRAEDFWRGVERVFKRLKQLRSHDMTFEQFLRRYCNDRSLAHARRLAEGFVEGFDAAHLDDISAMAIKKGEEEADADQPAGSDSFRVPGGIDQIIAYLREGISPETKFMTRAIVRTVRWKRGLVEIRLKSGRTIVARRSIITLPIGVLRAGDVQFLPELPEITAAVDQIAMGPVVKTIVQFREAFWENDEELKKLSFLHSHDQPVPTWWTSHPLRTSLVSGWAGGPAADRLSYQPRAKILHIAIESLARMLRRPTRKLNGLIEGWWIADWQADPFSRGAYSYIKVGGIDAPKRLARPVEQTFFFAGEATASEGVGGTVDAAISSGRRAAKQILRAL
jgi:monoamine oxidase